MYWLLLVNWQQGVLITHCYLFSVFLKYFLTSKTVRSAVLLVGLCDSGKTLIFSRVSPCNCNVLYTATLSSRGCLADARLMCVCDWSPISCLGSCCQESTNGPRPPSLTAALHTKPKTTRWVKFIFSHHPFMMIMVYRFPLSFLHSGHHLDSDRPARTWQPSLAVPGEIQICSQVRTCDVKSQVTWLIRPDQTLFSSSPLLHSSLQSDCICRGQRYLPEGSERRGRVPVHVVDGYCDLQERPGSAGGVQQTRFNNMFTAQFSTLCSLFS